MHFKLDTIWSCVVSFTPGPLYSRQTASSIHQITVLDGLHSQSGRYGRDSNLSPAPGIEHDSLNVQPVV